MFHQIVATEAQVGDVWLGNGDIRITAIGEGPTVVYVEVGTENEVTGPLVRIEGRIINGEDQGIESSWSVQPLQPMEVRRS